MICSYGNFQLVCEIEIQIETYKLLLLALCNLADNFDNETFFEYRQRIDAIDPFSKKILHTGNW